MWLRWYSCRDQLVIARQGAKLDVDLRAAGAIPAQAIELCLVGGIGKDQMPCEGALVAGTQLATVQRNGDDLPLADRELDAAPGESWIQRVVVRVKAEVGLLRDAQDAAQRGLGHRRGQRAHVLCLFDQALSGNGADAAVKARVGALLKPAVELLLEVQGIGEAPRRLKARAHKA